MSEQKFDRSKFKGAKLSTLKETKAEAEKKDVQLIGGDYDGRVNFHKIEDGRNEFRIMPAHDPNDPSYRAVRTSQLECEVPVYTDGKDTGKVTKKHKKIFIATQHGNEALKKLGKDPIELYIKYVGEDSKLIDNKDDRQTFLNPIRGWRGKDGKWNWGIMPSTTFVCYAGKDGVLGRLELWDKWVKQMDKITAAIEEEEKEILDYDPFSDPDEGYPIAITKEKNDKNKMEYNLDRVNPKKRQSWDEFCEENRISDVQLIELFEKESLTELYVDVYSKRDFDLAVNGLRILDKDNKFNIFENEDFLKELDEIEALVPEPKQKEDDVQAALDKAAANTTAWPKPKCKKYLKAYILDSYDGEDSENYLNALEALELGELRNWCSIAEAGEELPQLEEEDPSNDTEVPDDVQQEEEQEEESKEESKTSEVDSALANIASRRRRR